MQQIVNTILFGKYEIISILGTGSFSTVYLSKHKFLECYRAIKTLPKSCAGDSLLKEAQLLKSLHHPGIPTIYDIEQDDCSLYLIEEYIDGVSLEEFLLQQSHISLSVFLDFCLQLCEIFLYLHTRTPSPVLYMDLKPEHIIVCGTQLKLIDFNVATFLSNTGNIFNLYGNKDFCAPELFSGNAPNLLSDIYSIGKVMEYLSDYLDIAIPKKIHQIIKKTIDANPANRFETVEALIFALKKQKQNIYQEPSRKKIAVIGSHAGCGCTHISMSLVSTLNYLGYYSIYYERNPKNNLLTSQDIFCDLKEQDGLLCYKFFKGLPNYGPGVVIPKTDELFAIYDFGNSFPDELEDFDVILFICSNSFWHWKDAIDMERLLPKKGVVMKIICNLGQNQSMHWLATHFSQSVFRFSYDSCLFSTSQSKIDFVTKLLNIKRRNLLFLKQKKLLFPKKS